MATNDHIKKDLGIVTAYGEAVAGGYSGTREEFQAILVRMARGILDYNEQSNKPSINGVTLQGNKTTADLNINTGTNNYSSLTNKPSINGVTLQGNKTSADLNITAQGTINSKDKDGYVLKGGTNKNMFWGTDDSGNPAWRELLGIETNTTFSIGGNGNTTVTIPISGGSPLLVCSADIADSDIVINSVLLSNNQIRISVTNTSSVQKQNVRASARYIALV